MPFRKEHARLLVFAGTLTLIAALHVSYQFLIAPFYSYAKLTYTSPDPLIYGLLIVLILAMALIMPLRLARPSDFVLWVLYAVMVIPSMMIPYLTRTLATTTQLMMAFVITACFSGVILAARIPDHAFRARIRTVSPRVFWLGIILFSAATYGGLAASGAIKFAIPSLTQVYDVRAQFSDYLANNRVVGYLVPNQANVINPLVIATGLYLRRWWMVIVGMLGELVIYAAAAYKTVLFAIPVLLIVAFVFRKSRPRQSALIPWAFVGVISVSALIDAALHTPWITSLFTRRFMDLPGFLTGAWVSVFSEGPKALFAYSFLSKFFFYDYATPPAYVVAAQVLGSPQTNANANLFGDGYANFGWWGMAFESAILAVVLVLANKFSRGIPLMIVIQLFVMASITLANTSVVTALLTHGLVVGLIVLAAAPRSIWARSTLVQRGRRSHPPPAVAVPASSYDGTASWWQRSKLAAVAARQNHEG
jgi:hypothetical protein